MRTSRSLSLTVAAALVVATAPSRAQVRLPTINLPTSPPLSTVARSASTMTSDALGTVLTDVRKLRIQELLKANRAVLDLDRDGNLIVRGEVLAFTSTDKANTLARPAGIRVLRRESIAGLDLELLVLAVPADRSIHRLLRDLRRADPATVYDYNHIYLGVGDAAQPTGAPAVRAAPEVARSPASVGMIDSGVDATHPSLRGATVVNWGCDTAVPAAHGTAVASLIAGDDPPFHGASPHARVFAADVFCGRPTGGAVDAMASALGWLLGSAVPVVNVSLVGPRNAGLQMMIARVQAAGQVVVAAVGNDGPAAPPLYPAAYPGVVGVTGVDAKRHVLLEANRGSHVGFAAPGADMIAATVGGGYQEVRGTSYAAPIVAGLLADWCTKPDPGCGARAVEALSERAIRVGGRDKDSARGFGLVGEAVRTAPNK